MKLKLIFAVLASAAPIAVAQDNQPPTKPIYFLVDASGSMDGQNKADAELYLSALSLPRGQPVSITYFGKKPASPGANLCFEKLEVEDPKPRADNFSPLITGLGGSDDQTAITNAIDEMLSHLEDKGPARLIVVTDGQEGCNRNFSEIWSRHQGAAIEIEFRQVGDTPNLELYKLQEGPPPKPKVAPPLPPSPPAPTPPPTPPPKFEVLGSDSWLWILALFLFVGASLAFSFHYGRAASKLEHKIKTYEPPAKVEGEDRGEE